MSQTHANRVTKQAAQLAALARALPRSLSRRRAAPPRLRFVYDEMGPAMRYRVMHHAEQAGQIGMATQSVALNDLDRLYDLSACDLLYLHRLPLTSRTWPLLQLARLRKIPVVFDTDDLVWDQREREYNYLDARFPPATVSAILKTTQRLHAMMRRVDTIICATPYLAALAREQFRKPTYVHLNAVSDAMVAQADAALATRPAAPADRVTIGYFCGTARNHDEDLASINSALTAVLERFPACRLRIYGELELRGELADPRYQPQIERRALVPWHELQAQVATVNIALAPLIDNPQRRSKSAVKYLEAALVAVPTVAADLDPYNTVVRHGVTGLLANTPAAWYAALTRLVEQPQLRLALGTAARQDVLDRHTNTARAAAFAAILGQVCG